MSNCDDLRRIALSLPEAYEQDHFGTPSFRVNKKIFAGCAPESNRANLKLDPDHQMMLFDIRPDVFSKCVWGNIVRAYVELDGVDDAELEALLRHAWRQVAPKALIKAHALN